MSITTRLVAVAVAVPAVGAAGVIALVVAASAVASEPATGRGVVRPAAATCMPMFGAVATPGGVAGLSAVQLRNAGIVTRVAIGRGLGRSGAVIGVMTALTESSLIDVDHGDAAGPDSRGLFQQRAPWGPVSVRMDPAGAAGLFYRALVAVPGWQALPPWVAAQAVQQSQFADGSNYLANYRLAVTAVTAILGPAGASGSAGTDGAPAGCGIGGPGAAAGPATGSGAAVGAVADGAWGGYANGEIPASALCPLTSAGQLLRCDAAAAWDAMAAAYLTDTGHALCITDSYRPLAVQRQLRAEKPGLAAVPGTSNHGWGLAVDLCEPGRKPMSFTSPTYRWLSADAGRFGWTHPAWADPGRGQEEPWHWEYTGISS